MAAQASPRATPTTRDYKDGAPNEKVPVNCLLGRQVWPTPTSLAKAKDGNNEAGNSAGLVAIRKHALGQWPTPQARDHFPAHTPEYIAEKKSQGHGMANLNDVAAWTWPTPAAMEPDMDPETVLRRKERLSASTGVHRGPALPLGSMVKTTSGSSEPTEKRGALNPEFVCWLMGYPTEWVSCGASVTRSIRARPLSSSRQP